MSSSVAHKYLCHSSHLHFKGVIFLWCLLMFKPQWTTEVHSDPRAITMNVIMYIDSACLTGKCYFNKQIQTMNQICSTHHYVYYTSSKYGKITERFQCCRPDCLQRNTGKWYPFFPVNFSSITATQSSFYYLRYS
jgi:hypothetical protein